MILSTKPKVITFTQTNTWNGDNSANTYFNHDSILVNDTLYGNGGDDVLMGGGGNDKLFGGADNDTLDGGSGSDNVYGGTGQDTLNGGTGADYLAGGSGDDTYVVDDVGDVVDETERARLENHFTGDAGGTDTVRTSLNNYTLGSFVENLTFFGTGYEQFTGTGNALDNFMTVEFGQASLYGMDGDDNLQGAVYDDVLDGGNGNDELFGGQGDDVLSGGDGNDFLDLDFGIFQPNRPGADYMSGADLLMGGNGNDVYGVDNVGDQVIENAGEGTDTVFTTLNSYTLTDNVENLIGGATEDGFVDFHGTGNDLDNRIIGMGGNDTLDGGAGNDELHGDFKDEHAGADHLRGGAGDDTLRGGNGADTFVYRDGDTGNDTITDFSEESGDRIDLSGVSGVTGFGDLTISQVGSDTVITYGDQTITLSGVDASTLDGSEFDFGPQPEPVAAEPDMPMMFELPDAGLIGFDIPAMHDVNFG